MCALAHLCEYVTNATMDPFRVGVLSVEEWEFLMPTIAKSVHSRRKIGMDAPKLLIWGVPKQIYSMNVRNMVLRKDDDHWIDTRLVLLTRSFLLELTNLDMLEQLDDEHGINIYAALL